MLLRGKGRERLLDEPLPFESSELAEDIEAEKRSHVELHGILYTKEPATNGHPSGLGLASNLTPNIPPSLSSAICKSPGHATRSRRKATPSGLTSPVLSHPLNVPNGNDMTRSMYVLVQPFPASRASIEGIEDRTARARAALNGSSFTPRKSPLSPHVPHVSTASS